MSQPPAPSDRGREVTAHWPIHPTPNGPARDLRRPPPSAAQPALDQHGRPLARGFPDYESPPPSPPNHTSLIVGSCVLVALAVFAVVGFWLVA